MGILLFPTPDLYGRKRMITIAALMSVVGCWLTMAGPTKLLKSVGYFVLGFFHIRGSLCYIMSFEFNVDVYKSVNCTIINVVDGLTMFFLCGWLKFVNSDLIMFLTIATIVGTSASIILILIIPESPKWSITRDRQMEARKVINYISMFNGSDFRVGF